jgi:putative phosphoribosyl transferase
LQDVFGAIEEWVWMELNPEPRPVTFIEQSERSFQNRVDAGRQLGAQLQLYSKRKDVIVLGIPRGGVLVAAEVARALDVPLDIFISRKLGVPGQEELAFGAVASGGVRVLDRKIIEEVGISIQQVEQITEQAKRELERREKLYRGDRPLPNLENRTVFLVDDGIATGASMRAAILALRQFTPARIIVAVPVAPVSTWNRLQAEVDELVCVHTPKDFDAIGRFYSDFSQVPDGEVTELFHRAANTALRNT